MWVVLLKQIPLNPAVKKTYVNIFNCLTTSATSTPVMGDFSTSSPDYA